MSVLSCRLHYAAFRSSLKPFTCSSRLVVHRHGTSVMYRTVTTARPLSLCLGFAMRQPSCLGMRALCNTWKDRETY